MSEWIKVFKDIYIFIYIFIAIYFILFMIFGYRFFNVFRRVCYCLITVVKGKRIPGKLH